MNLFFVWRLPLMILLQSKDITWAIGRGGGALKQLCSHLHKITNEPVFYMMLAPYDFDAGQRHYLGT